MQVFVGGCRQRMNPRPRCGSSGSQAVAGHVALVAELDGPLARDCACVTHGDRLISSERPRRPAMMKTAPKLLSRAIVFALR